jgi:hypothetical protein
VTQPNPASLTGSKAAGPTTILGISRARGSSIYRANCQNPDRNTGSWRRRPNSLPPRCRRMASATTAAWSCTAPPRPNGRRGSGGCCASSASTMPRS